MQIYVERFPLGRYVHECRKTICISFLPYTHTNNIILYIRISIYIFEVRMRGENVFTNFVRTPTTENAVLYITLLCVLY